MAAPYLLERLVFVFSLRHVLNVNLVGVRDFTLVLLNFQIPTKFLAKQRSTLLHVITFYCSFNKTCVLKAFP
jgi:hypothetical protein